LTGQKTGRMPRERLPCKNTNVALLSGAGSGRSVPCHPSLRWILGRSPPPEDRDAAGRYPDGRRGLRGDRHRHGGSGAARPATGTRRFARRAGPRPGRSRFLRLCRAQRPAVRPPTRPGGRQDARRPGRQRRGREAVRAHRHVVAVQPRARTYGRRRCGQRLARTFPHDARPDGGERRVRRGRGAARRGRAAQAGDADPAGHRPGPRSADGLLRPQSRGRVERPGRRLAAHEHQAPSTGRGTRRLGQWSAAAHHLQQRISTAVAEIARPA
jgi:hypothetical protein